MIASAIAYGLTALFLFLGLGGVIVFFRSKGPDSLISLSVTVVLLGLAWGCAYLGGI